MRYFHTIQTVEVDRTLVAKAKLFARAVTPTVGYGSGYADSNQHNLKKIENDHFISKVGEEAVRIIFERFGGRVCGPDYQIYQGRAKSWDFDLYVDAIGIAVKTQSRSSSIRFGTSWMFQASQHRKDPILNASNAWICFVEVDEISFQGKVYPPYQIKQLTFEEPKLIKLRSSKKVVYAASLPQLLPQLPMD